MEYEDQLIPNIKSVLKSVSTYEFRPNNDISNNKIKDYATQTVGMYLVFNNSNYVLKSDDIIVESDNHNSSVVHIKFSDELKKVLYELDKIIIK